MFKIGVGGEKNNCELLSLQLNVFSETKYFHILCFRGGSHAVQILQILKLQSRGSSEALLTSSQNFVTEHRAHWPCVHPDCVCVFKTLGALKSHLSRSHTTVRIQEN